VKYRKLGKLDFETSVLGFGCMRLPTLDGKEFGRELNEPEAIALVRHAIDQGVNYLDTAPIYHGGQSETIVARILQDGYVSGGAKARHSGE
jgi:predicted aldo/keto reductase-like oxidoreductase